MELFANFARHGVTQLLRDTVMDFADKLPNVMIADVPRVREKFARNATNNARFNLIETYKILPSSMKM